MSLNKLYTPKQTEILKACRNNDWFMLINHGAKRSGKTQLDNDLFLQDLIKVRKTADSLGIDTPQYILAGYSMGNIQDRMGRYGNDNSTYFRAVLLVDKP